MKGRTKGRRIAARAVLGFALCTVSVVQVAAQTPTQVSPDEFASLRWLEGRWFGSGDGVEAFHESYRFLDDGTIEQSTWPDATFTTPDSRSVLELRGGFVTKSRDGTVESVVTHLDDEEIRFEWAERGRPGFRWTRISDDAWVAVLERRGQAPVVYNMRRLSGQG
jgi:hypothetical protein